MKRIRVFVGQDKKGKKLLMCEVDNQEAALGELALGLIFGKDESVLKALGETEPDVIVDDLLDDKMNKEVHEFQELLDKFYEKVYQKK